MHNLYVFRPKGHGEHTFCVVAASESEARHLVDEHVKTTYLQNGRLAYEADGWGTDYYQMQVVPVGQVFEHENE